MRKTTLSRYRLLLVSFLSLLAAEGKSQVLYDNGPYYNGTGNGSGGANTSTLYTTTFGMGTIGFGHQAVSYNRVADDFAISDCYWRIDSIVFFGYQTNSTTTSTFTAVNFRIWDSIPDAAGSNIVFGDTTTNRLTRTVWSGAYRVTETTVTNTARPLMRNVCSVSNLMLPAGTYWLDWSSSGSLASGPWAPPRTPIGLAITGNGRQRIGSVWNNLVDGGTNTPAQGLPFIIYGTAFNATANAGTDVSICIGTSVTIGGSPAGSGSGTITYAWNPSAFLSSTSIGNPVAAPSVTTSCFLAVTDSLGCVAHDTMTITVNNPSYDTISPVSCVAYMSPGGNMYTASGTYSDTLTNVAGCDSIISINLTINNAAASSMNASTCDTVYTSPAGNVYTSSGVYYDTLTTIFGCDSIVTINLSFLSASTSSVTASSCYSYTSPGGNIFTASGIYNDTITNVSGCDSIITIDLTILNSTQSSITATGCGTYTAPSGAVFTASGVYNDTITNIAGCDSIISIDLTILNSTQSSITASACRSYTAPSGAVYDSSGVYIDTLQNSLGCDSIITINLNVIHIDTTVTQVSMFDVTSNEGTQGATYQWVNCITLQPVPGATSQTFNNGYAVGNYFVIITVGNCVDTSECVFVNAWGIEEYASNSIISLYPNPGNGQFTVVLPEKAEEAVLTVTDLSGRVLWSEKSKQQVQIPVVIDAPAGMYMITVRTEKYTAVEQFIISK